MKPTTRTPAIEAALPGITQIDTVMVGERELNSVYLIHAERPTLVESGPAADGPVILEALSRLGVGAADLANIVVTHVHLDHAGGAGRLLDAFPSATIWVHERGARHLVDPSRLIASTERTYGPERMERFYGRTVPAPADAVRAVSDGDSIRLGDRELLVVHAPGHASHQVALLESATGAVFTGEAVGTHLPWSGSYRPALPPPEVDVVAALDTIERIRRLRPAALFTSHFGSIASADEGCDRAASRVRSWADRVRTSLERDPDAGTAQITQDLRDLVRTEFLVDAGREMTDEDLARYDVIGSIGMNAAGLSRYWRKRWEREAEVS